MLRSDIRGFGQEESNIGTGSPTREGNLDDRAALKSATSGADGKEPNHVIPASNDVRPRRPELRGAGGLSGCATSGTGRLALSRTKL